VLGRISVLITSVFSCYMLQFRPGLISEFQSAAVFVTVRSQAVVVLPSTLSDLVHVKLCPKTYHRRDSLVQLVFLRLDVFHVAIEGDDKLSQFSSSLISCVLTSSKVCGI